jgi:hypothetical protein
MAMLPAYRSRAAQGLMVTGAGSGRLYKRGKIKVVSRNFSVPGMLRRSNL